LAVQKPVGEEKPLAEKGEINLRRVAPRKSAGPLKATRHDMRMGTRYSGDAKAGPVRIPFSTMTAVYWGRPFFSPAMERPHIR
jgi:hypothetical protein